MSKHSQSSPDSAAADASARSDQEHAPVDQAFSEDVASAPGDSAAPRDNASNPGSSDPLEQLRQERDEAAQRALRCQADLENYRKRARRELDEALKYATLPLVRDLLPVFDNLQRAIESDAGTEGGANGVLQGVRMVLQQLNGILQQHHIHVIEAAGQDFDPSWHEAVAQVPHAEQAPGSVVDVAQSGYRLHERVIRPAQVIVAKPPE